MFTHGQLSIRKMGTRKKISDHSLSVKQYTSPSNDKVSTLLSTEASTSIYVCSQLIG